MPRKLPTSFYLVLLVILLAGNIGVYRAIFAPPVPAVIVLAVGEKGGATIVRSPSGEIVLVDAGPDAGILRALGAALAPWERTIGTVVLTGTQAGLIGGLPEVLSRYRVSALARAGAQGPKSLEAALAAAASAETGLQQKSIPYGVRLALSDGTSIDVIASGVFRISFDTASLDISSSTPAGVYLSDGVTIRGR
ncbi:hypothetical protein HY972_01065 [Candidatus Kaiserbacteria bacterium]|nr:hypothetical protein [Candidatus Kaiserbacteria bacterium]